MDNQETVAFPPKQAVCGVKISATSYAEVADFCTARIDQKRHGISTDSTPYICVTSVHGVMEARQDRELRRILNRAAIATPDGMPLVWALRSLGRKSQQRVYGPNLMLSLCERAAREQHRIFLYGSTDAVLRSLVEKLQTKYPRIRITGTYSPPFRPLTEEEESGVRRQILASAADIVFVGISTPKQEKWMARQQQHLPGVIMIGVGAAFDFHAGKVKQAPAWMQNRGLEWLFRLCTEPRRLWRRYILVTPRFLPLWALQLSGFGKFEES